ncbi:efflux RND transporter periplasmic adaptor subunit [Phreatobacter stygius]|uniref:Efflux RND transporter periplasmic adaptor subunit n=1 Tax=Phreatobacter stygius TaxID=1940610 RepID=A0A4D7B497_9HYPH|nr:efflux RND transporter periplasmic adaptor subunit [Phreatobacter stygius]QCI66045.1 efflux RND transporter periplasmic adaptor subunit [Phreatobacter stygius]
MSRAPWVVAAFATLGVAGAGGFVSAWPNLWPAQTSGIITPAAAEVGRTVIYYQDPDGRPFYSLTPKKTADGREFRPVRAGQDLSFEPAADVPATEPAPAARAASRRVLYYRNPMGLPDTSPVPKKDSMGMDYIAVHEGDDDGDGGAIRLTPGRIQRTGVKTEPAALRVIRTVIRAPGTIQLDERRIAVISLRTEGWVQKVEDVTTGSRVRKGQPLMEIYSPAISAAAADYAAQMPMPGEVRSDIRATPGPGRGSRQRLMNLDVPEAVITTIERTRVAPLTIAWAAPRDGIVLERNAIEGTRVQPGDVLFRLADISLVWTLIDVAERDLGSLRTGLPVTVRARGHPGRAFDGRIAVIYPQINRETRTVRLRIELPNADAALLPEMYVDAEVDIGSQQPVPAIPESAVIDSGSRQVVFVDRGDGRFEPREVKLGARGGGYVEIRGGVAVDEPVVIAATFLIDAESNLRAALRGFTEAGARP